MKRIVLLLAMIVPLCSYSQQTRNFQDVFDEVNNAVDDTNCGVNGVAQAAVDTINREIVDEINESIKNILDSYNLGCLDDLLDAGFLGIFNIDFTIPGFCELVQDQIGKNAIDPLYKTDKGKELKRLIDENVQHKNEFKKKVTEW
jgi:hypothetical protein